jgi:hypothetical protein
LPRPDSTTAGSVNRPVRSNSRNALTRPAACARPRASRKPKWSQVACASDARLACGPSANSRQITSIDPGVANGRWVGCGSQHRCARPGGQIADNFNTLVMLRVKVVATAGLLTSQLPEVDVVSIVVSSSVSDTRAR